MVEPTSRQPAVVVRDVSLHYRVFEEQRRPTLRRLVARRFRPRTYRTVEAVREVSLVARQGEAIGIIGRNGSGKSTLLRVIAGLLPPTRGEVYARSVPLMLGVGAALHPELSGRRNVFLGCTALGMDRGTAESRFHEIVEFAGLHDFIDLPLKAYSSGMKARLQFSIATTVRPEVLLIDEALAVGDEEFKQKSERRINDLLDDAGAVFFVSHSMGSVRKLCSRGLWLDEGRVQVEGPIDEVVDAYREAAHADDGR